MGVTVKSVAVWATRRQRSRWSGVLPASHLVLVAETVRACAKLVEVWIKAKILTKSYLLKLKVYFISVWLLVSVSVCAHDCRYAWRPEKDTGSTKTGFASSCELPNMNVGNWTQTLCRSSENSYLLSHLSLLRELLFFISPHTVIITLCAWVTVMGAGGGHWNRGHRWWGWVTPRPTNRFPLGEILTKDFCILRTILLPLGSSKIKSFFIFALA